MDKLFENLKIAEPELTMQKAQFEALIGEHFSVRDQAKIMRAYRLSKYGHRGQMRENGVRYFEHPKAIAVLLVRLGIRDAAVICAALLHDVVEDSFILLYADIGIYCCSHTQHLVRILTKDKLNGMTIHQYFDRLGNDTPESWIGKLGDRWHNLQTLVDSEDPIEHEKYRRKKLKQVMETREFIIPLARKLASLSKYRTLGFWLPLRKKWVARANYGDLGRWFERELTALCDQREAEAISEAVYM